MPPIEYSPTSYVNNYERFIGRKLELQVSQKDKVPVHFADLEVGETFFSPKLLGSLTVIDKGSDSASLANQDSSITVYVDSNLKIHDVV
ncbi:MAG: hypothetical protein A2383_04075 [Candidatus Pacebacteria bacterium RIFOXYB1_FULL_39_46]|nr:MAG: hypothetical protein A2383_04075 [Candidatus Pacebacteria bacterium RIFOXYB1_FULL_39_46]OGJ39134.1 MAG: hypothetical protein A2182_02320 [Candidatus Pacebacteria bacterium RIFOXYA1_FULL_38_18]OGJ40166.1 MAG: hypothetical protein A2582_03690 [Candidatus Pacebacteria bacterium RIFOXYD1_FULL_39_27]OGJ41050.1 MAG: hypothetical protein A2411_01035 [Candidatus Pacebacteria bacterium RIFOXYC1_FULL_39_21]